MGGIAPGEKASHKDKQNKKPPVILPMNRLSYDPLANAKEHSRGAPADKQDGIAPHGFDKTP